jgi:hypothetical protein
VSASSAGEQAWNRRQRKLDARPRTVPAMNEPLTEEQQLIHRQALRDGMPKTPFMGWLGIVFER